MAGLEIRFVMDGKEMSVDSFVEAVVREIRISVREEISRILSTQQKQGRTTTPSAINEPSRQGVSVHEAARLLSLSRRTTESYMRQRLSALSG